MVAKYFIFGEFNLLYSRLAMCQDGKSIYLVRY